MVIMTSKHAVRRQQYKTPIREDTVQEIINNSLATPHLLDMVKYIDDITNPSWSFFNFSSKINAGHGRDLVKKKVPMKYGLENRVIIPSGGFLTRAALCNIPNYQTT